MRLMYQEYGDFPTLPGAYVAGMKTISNLSENSITELQDAFKSSDASLRPKELALQVSAKVSPPLVDQVRRIVNTLIGLYSLRAFLGLSVSDFLQELERADQEDEDDEVKSLTPEEKIRVKERLLVLLELGGSLGVTSKANDVMTEHDKVFRKARVLTDVRPIFQPDPAARPAAAVMIHTLKIEYRHDYQPKALFVALDTTDIRALREVLERAEQKSESIALMLEASKVPYLSVEE